MTVRMTGTRPSDPPGRRRVPLLGETLAFLRDSYGFTSDRFDQFGPVFTTSLLGRRRIVISGPEACAAWVDEAYIRRADSMPGPVLDVFGGASLPLLDGDAHRVRKHLVTKVFGAGRLDRYAAEIEHLIAEFFADAAGRPDAVAGVEALRTLAIECLCKNILGMDPGPDVHRLAGDYQIVFAAPNGVPLNVPGTSLRRAIAARDRIFQSYDRMIAARRSYPTDDGLSTLLTDGPDGEAIDDEGARLELHHLVLAGYIVFGELVGALIQLDAHREVEHRLRAEVLARSPEGPVTAETLRALPYLCQVVDEVKRHTPVVNIFFGVAARDFSLSGHRIPEGRSVLLSITGCNRSTHSWSEPDRFDPDRFAPGRAEHRRHEHAFVPQGPGQAERSHACAGIGYTTLLMGVFLVHLMRGYDWSLPPQDLGYDWSRIPAEPKDGLLLEIHRR